MHGRGVGGLDGQDRDEAVGIVGAVRLQRLEVPLDRLASVVLVHVEAGLDLDDDGAFMVHQALERPLAALQPLAGGLMALEVRLPPVQPPRFEAGQLPVGTRIEDRALDPDTDGPPQRAPVEDPRRGDPEQRVAARPQLAQRPGEPEGLAWEERAPEEARAGQPADHEQERGDDGQDRFEPIVGQPDEIDGSRDEVDEGPEDVPDVRHAFALRRPVEAFGRIVEPGRLG